MKEHHKAMKNTQIKHVWFDMAGTLYRETPLFKDAHNKLKYSTYAKLVGQKDFEKAKEEYEALYSKHRSNSGVFVSLGKPSDYWQNTFDELDVTKLLQPDPAIHKTLKAIKTIAPISVFSNFRANQIASYLTYLGIPPEEFTYLLSGDDVKERKPALHGFHKMIKLSKVSPEQIMFIGDRVNVDIKPAKQVGMKTCLIYSQSEEADFSVQSFQELLDVVKKI
jgi:FMN phosphatase YigB (HAD superfamily)